MHNVYQQLQTLGIVLPDLAIPQAAYLPYVQNGKTIYLSGHIAKKAGQVWRGKLGLDMDTSTGQAAARAVAIDLLGTLHAACQASNTDLNGIQRIVKLMSLVNSTPEFTEQHLVTNGCSDLLGQVFGESGQHARSAFGVAQIPLGACVEIEMIVELA